MFQVKSYILKPGRNVTDLDDVARNPQNDFVEITDLKGLESIRRKLDFKYLAGAIWMHYHGQLLLDHRYWDLVDQLWAYILNLVDEVLQKGEGSVCFPDQPVELGLKLVHQDWLIFSVKDSQNARYLLPRHDFLTALVLGAEQFFNGMINAFGLTGQYARELEKVKRLKIEREIAIPARLSLAGERPFKRRWMEYVILSVDIDGRSIRTTVESG